MKHLSWRQLIKKSLFKSERDLRLG